MYLSLPVSILIAVLANTVNTKAPKAQIPNVTPISIPVNLKTSNTSLAAATNIEVLYEHNTKEIFGDGVVEGAKLIKRKGEDNRVTRRC